MKIFAGVVSSLLLFALLLGFLFGMEHLGIAWEGYFGPKRAAVKREVFKETRSYNEGMIQQLARYRLQYIKAESDVEKEAIASTVRNMFAEYDKTKLSPELRNFLGKVGL